MYNEELNVLHIHIPKTAGTSIKQLLFGRDAPTRHETAAEFPADLWERAFTFTVVRNPFDRLASSYVYHVESKYKGVLLTRHPDLKSLSFREYLERFTATGDRGVLFCSQVEYIDHPDTDASIDAVLRFESLEQDFAAIRSRLRTDAPLGHTLRMDRHPYREYCSDSERALIEQNYRDDIDRFGYEF